MHFLSTPESEALIKYFIKLLNEDKDAQDRVYTCDKPSTKFDVTMKYKDGILSAWLNERDATATTSLLAEFDNKELILTIYAGERTDQLRKVIFSQSIRECIFQSILRKYGYRVYFARKRDKKIDIVYCQCSILDDKGDFTLERFRVHADDSLYFRFDLKNLKVEHISV